MNGPAGSFMPVVERHHDARFINRVVNDPAVHPWVCGHIEGAIDLTPVVEDQHNVLLAGQHGGVLFFKLQPGIYEAHTQVLREGRGRWAVDMVQESLLWMFSRTDAMEIMTRCPQGNIGALALAKRVGGRYAFTNRAGWIYQGKPVPAAVYSLTVQEWVTQAPRLVALGHSFHEQLEAEYRRLGAADPTPHPEDEEHDRYVGMAHAMIAGGQPRKAALFYNRWAALAGYAPIRVIKDTPPITVDIQDAILVAGTEGRFWAASTTKPSRKEMH